MAELRALVKQAAALQAAADYLRRDLADHDRALAALAYRQEGLVDAIASARTRLATATRTLNEHDRPLRRRNHRMQIAQAKDDLRRLPGHIENLEGELAALPEAVDTERAAQERLLRRAADPRRRRNHERVEQALDDDARLRGEHDAEELDPLLTVRLGPVPDESTAREGWINAAGRIAQHHAVWDLPDDVILGPRPPLGGVDYGVTYYAAQRAAADLDRARGRERISVSRPGLGISL